MSNTKLLDLFSNDLNNQETLGYGAILGPDFVLGNSYRNEIVIDKHKKGKVKLKQDDVSVTVTSTGTVENYKGDTIKITGENAFVTVEKGGKLIAGDEGIQIKGDLAVVSNRGVIKSTESGIHIKEYSHATVKNYGEIHSAEKKGINLGDNDHSNITNYGYISAKTEGIEAGSHGMVVNEGVVFAHDDDAINVEDNTLVINHGRVESLKGDGIDMNSGKVYNMLGAEILTHDTTQGAIDIDAADASLQIVNHGVIRGGYGIKTDDGTKGPIDTQSQTIHNFGIIHGTSEEAITVNNGSDIVHCYGGSQIIGDVDLGAGNDSFHVISSNVALTNTLVDGGFGSDVLSFDNSFSYSEVVNIQVALSPAEGTDVPYANMSLRDGSGNTLDISFAGFEYIAFEDKQVSFWDLVADKTSWNSTYREEYTAQNYDQEPYDQFVFQPEADWIFG